MLAKQKIVQSYIQAIIEVVNLIKKADAIGQHYKAKFIADQVDLTGTNLTQAQVTAIATFLADLNAIANGAVADTAESKDVPSQGTGALD